VDISNSLNSASQSLDAWKSVTDPDVLRGLQVTQTKGYVTMFTVKMQMPLVSSFHVFLSRIIGIFFLFPDEKYVGLQKLSFGVVQI